MDIDLAEVVSSKVQSLRSKPLEWKTAALQALGNQQVFLLHAISATTSDEQLVALIEAIMHKKTAGPYEVHDDWWPIPECKEEVESWAAAVLERGLLLDGQVPPDQQERAQKLRTFVDMPGMMIHFLPASLHRSFYNRPNLLYKIMSLPQQGTQVFLVAGDSGVGTSTFMLRLVCKLAAAGQKVLVRYRSGSTTDPDAQLYVDFSNPDNIKVDWTHHDSPRFQGYYHDPDVWELIDGDIPQPHARDPHRIVICASTDAQNWRQLANIAATEEGSSKIHPLVMKVLHMPSWTEQELIEAAFHKGLISSLTDEDEVELVRARMRRFGGCPRKILNNVERTATELLNDLPGEDALQLLSGNFESVQPCVREDFLCTMVDEHGCVSYELKSPGYAEIVRRRAQQWYWPQVTGLLTKQSNNPHMAKVLAGVFGDRAHMIGRQGLVSVMGLRMTAAHVCHLPQSAAGASVWPAYSSMGVPVASNHALATASGQADDCINIASMTTSTSMDEPEAIHVQEQPIKRRRADSPVAVASLSSTQQQDMVQIAEAFNKPHKPVVDVDLPLKADIGSYIERVHGQAGACDAVMYDTEAGFLMLQHSYHGARNLNIDYYEHLLDRIQQAEPTGSKQVHIVFVVPQHTSHAVNQMSACKFMRTSVGRQCKVLDWSEVPQELRDIPMWVVRLPMAPVNANLPHYELLERELEVLKDKWAVFNVMQKTKQGLVKQLDDLGVAMTGSRKQLAQRLLYEEGLSDLKPAEV